MPRKRIPCLLALCICLNACGGGHVPAVPTVALAVDGPPLAVVGEYGSMHLEGSMERAAMTGFGLLSLQGEEDGHEFVCRAEIDSPPTEKGRIPGVLSCTGDKKLIVSLRNLGPDQGVGIAKAPVGKKEMLIFFYHSSREEAVRRLPSVKKDIEEALAKRQSEEGV